MRDQDRISEMLDTIRIIWEKNPDLRLGQLLANCHVNTNLFYDLFYREDDDMLARLKETYSKDLS